MENDLNVSPKKQKRKVRLGVRLIVPMLLIVILQLVMFFAILAVGGEFSYIQQYSYHSLAEKTENRRNYIEKELTQKVPYVNEYANRINSLVRDILTENGASVSDLQKDRDLNRSILLSSVDTLVGLLRRDSVNDVYLILETGDLYNDRGVGDTRAALYLRDLDTKTDTGYDDLLMEVGFTSISQEYGIVLDSGWTLYFMSDPQDERNFDFYYKTLQTARENPDLEQTALGYWSGFSRVANGNTVSMKYSVPLIARDGTVYGVMGIGLTENTILSGLPVNDFLSETACYVLGRDNSDDNFDIMTHSGTAFYRLVGSADALPLSETLDEDVYDFALPGGSRLAGSVKHISLYDENSPFYSERWALISVADRASVLSPLTSLIRMLSFSSLASMVISVVIVILSCYAVVKPITNAIKVMSDDRQYRSELHFQPSNIYEIDKMTDAIAQLQVNVRDFSSQVSKMIRIADVGLGTFMYNRTDDSVYVGQSFQKFLWMNERQEKDVMMSRTEFLSRFIAEDIRLAITEGLELTTGDDSQEAYTKVFSTEQEDGGTVWTRLSMIYTRNSSIGILQDITDTMMEKKRIEFERDYDGFTGLLNRHAYYRRVEELFRDKNGLKITAFVMIDLDNLKFVNDTYGHDFGDEYIKTAATILKRFQSYGGIVSRISGDEFNICLPGFSSKDEVREIINTVREELLKGSCLLADGTHFKVRASIGVSWYPDDAHSYELLMKYADFAMYTIKHSTKGEIAEFDISAYNTDSLLLTGVEEMNRIIDESSVKYAFQSIVSVKTGEIIGYEALMRVQSTVFQSPLELLRTAKSGARLYEIERLTWTKSLEDFQAQIDAGRIAPTSRIFVNSIANCELDLADTVAIENAYPNLLSQVVLEILESESANEVFSEHKIKRMKKWHAQVALDDFGTGYNSEYALITLQPNIIKIDRSIISGCDKDMSRRMIINSLVKLARTKQISVLAEGVETEEEMKAVIACGVDLLQGYYFSHPLYEPEPLSPELAETIRRLGSARGGQ